MFKKSIFLLLAICCAVFSKPLPKVAVYVTGGKTVNENKALSARITHALVNSGKYNTIERSDAFLDQVAKEITTQRSGTIDDRQISKLGQQAGADFVCIGEILEAFGAHQISARIVNVASVEVTASGLASGQLKTMGDFATLSNQVVASLLGITQTATPASGVVEEQDAPLTPIQVQDFSNEPVIAAEGSNLQEKLQWLQANATSNTKYRVEVTRDEEINPYTLSFAGKRNVTIRLRSTGKERVISPSDRGSLFTIGSGVTLILENNIALQSQGEQSKRKPSIVKISGGPKALITVYDGGELIMSAGSKITGQTSTCGWNGGKGGGVFVAENGSFTMKGGEIYGNSAHEGGGVYVSKNGTFKMEAGEISGNTATQGCLGGRCNSRGCGMGGGVFVAEHGTFVMTGGEISGNTANDYGGGVFVQEKGIFTKSGGTIFGYLVGDRKSNKVSEGMATNNNGHSVFNTSDKHREATAGSNVKMDSRKSGTTGGWE
jgi:hypothetical protein